MKTCLKKPLALSVPRVLPARLPELDSDDVVDILQEFEPEERDEILAAMPVAERLIVQKVYLTPKIRPGG